MNTLPKLPNAALKAVWAKVVPVSPVESAPEEMMTRAVKVLSLIHICEAVPAKDVLKIFRLLEEEDPMLHVQWEEEQGEIQVRIMGPIQLEVLGAEVKQRFGLEVSFGPCRILYRETIATSAVGYGHFEPLRHYAEVHVKLERCV